MNIRDITVMWIFNATSIAAPCSGFAGSSVHYAYTWSAYSELPMCKWRHAEQMHAVVLNVDTINLRHKLVSLSVPEADGL